MDTRIDASQRLKSQTITTIPGDKSISHRSIILSSLSESTVHIHNFLFSEDCVNTLKIFQKLGVPITADPGTKSVQVKGVGLYGLLPPDQPLHVGNAGTGIRLISGILAWQRFQSAISGDHSIEARPMSRIISPLSQMGADIAGNPGAKNQIYPPLHITGNPNLTPITYTLPVASAQVKSCVLFAGLGIPGETTVIEPEKCRDHTERMLQFFQADITLQQDQISLKGGKPLQATDPDLHIPSDISSAAFFIVLGLLIPDFHLQIDHIGLNPSRDKLIRVLQLMGGNIMLENTKLDYFEPQADIHVAHSELHSVEIPEEWIPVIIDEIPILAIAGLFSKDGFSVRNAEELRVKESDRITSIVAMVRAMGGTITEYPDGFDIHPGTVFRDFEVDSHGDHRIAMAAIIGAIASQKQGLIKQSEWINTSFPNFLAILESLQVRMCNQ